jgi:hypothetical protein
MIVTELEMKILRFEERLLNLESVEPNQESSVQENRNSAAAIDKHATLPIVDADTTKPKPQTSSSIDTLVKPDANIDRKQASPSNHSFADDNEDDEDNNDEDDEENDPDETNDVDDDEDEIDIDKESDKNDDEDDNDDDSDGPETKDPADDDDDDNYDDYDTSHALSSLNPISSKSQLTTSFRPKTIEEELRPSIVNSIATNAESPVKTLSPLAPTSPIRSSPWMTRPRAVLPSIGSPMTAGLRIDNPPSPLDGIGKASSNQSSPNSDKAPTFPSPRLRNRFPQSVRLQDDLGSDLSSTQSAPSSGSSSARSPYHDQKLDAHGDSIVESSKIDTGNKYNGPSRTIAAYSPPTKQAISSPLR